MSEEINEIDETVSAEKAVGSPTVETDKGLSAPLKRDPVTGKFIKGTGGSLNGGRPVGSRDRISKKMIELATELMHDHGQEMMLELAKRDPAAALAICTRLIPNSTLAQAHEEIRTGQKDDRPMSISINLVSALPAASESRVERLEHGDLSTQHIIEHAAEQAAREPVDQVWDEVSQADLDHEVDH